MEKISAILTKERVIAPGANACLSDVLLRQRIGHKLLMVCDDQTWLAAGQAIAAQLGARAAVHSLGRYVRPLLAHAAEVAGMAADYDGLVAVGSGTINDITKYAATMAQKPYVCVATAASMNGYISAGVSLEENGVKHSYPAQPPRAVIADMTVIAAAPKRLARAGLGDTLCRSTVEADAMISHYLLGTDYPRSLFDRMRAHEPGLIINAGKLRDGGTMYLSLLMAALLEAGDAMAMHGSSAPASQGEHMIAHTADMLYGSELRHIMHGEMVAVTTLTMGRLQQRMLLSMPTVRPLPRDMVHFTRLFGKAAGPSLCDMYARKLLTAEQAEEITIKLAHNWTHMKEEINAIMVQPNTVERTFIRSMVPAHSREIKMVDEHYQSACLHAYLTRDRFTFLDLAAMAGKRHSHLET